MLEDYDWNEYYQRVSQDPERWNDDPMINLFIDEVFKNKCPSTWAEPKTIFDAGSGNGLFSNVLAQEGMQVTAVDPFTADDLKFYNLSNKIEYIPRDLQKINYQHVFDGVWCRLVLPFVDDPIKTISNLTLSLKPGGVLVISAFEAYKEDYEDENIMPAKTSEWNDLTKEKAAIIFLEHFPQLTVKNIIRYHSHKPVATADQAPNSRAQIWVVAQLAEN